MKIRFATVDDIPQLIEFGRRCHAMTRFRVYNYDALRMEATLRGIIESKSGANCLFVAEGNERAIIGVLVGALDRHFFSDHVVASIVHYDVLPEKRMSGAAVRLLTAFRKWAENRGAFELSAGVNSGTDLDRTDKFLKRLGFAPTGGNYSILLSR
jgi:hypothetical protein